MQNPATTDLDTGIIELHPSFFSLDTNSKKFVLAHEKGHYKLQTINEVEADNFGIAEFEKTKPKNIYNIQNFLNEALPKQGSENRKRRYNVLLKALYYDYVHNNNIEAYNKLQFMKKKGNFNRFANTTGDAETFQGRDGYGYDPGRRPSTSSDTEFKTETETVTINDTNVTTTGTGTVVKTQTEKVKEFLKNNVVLVLMAIASIYLLFFYKSK